MLNSFEGQSQAERIIVALDCDKQTALGLADALEGHARWVKVGMTLYYAEGPSIVQAFKQRGFDVFLDLKFHDIPHQVQGAAASAAQAGADMLTMHACGGLDMMRAGCEGAAEGAARIGAPDPITLAITVLTSMDAATLSDVGVQRPLEDQVRALALLASDAGTSGVVASPMEAAMLRKTLGDSACIVTPGVRPAGSSTDDQSRIATPKNAFEAGASHLVIGRPITQADDPADAFDAIVASLRQ